MSIISGVTIEVLFPSGRRQQFNLKGGSSGGKRAGAWATELAKLEGLPLGRKRWQLRGPLGVLHSQLLMRKVDLKPSEYLTLETKATTKNGGGV